MGVKVAAVSEAKVKSKKVFMLVQGWYKLVQALIKK